MEKDVVIGFASALHRTGIPEARIEDIRAAIEGGKYVVILYCQPDESERFYHAPELGEC